MDLDTFEGLKQKMHLSTMSRPVLIGIAAVLVAVAVVCAGRLVGAATASEFTVVKGEAQQAQPQAQGGSAAESASEEQSSVATIFVHVTGAVAQPGLCELPEGARVAQAVQQAGGFTDEAAPESVNLARVLSDGEQVAVRTREEANATVEAAADSAGPLQQGAVSATPGRVNINTADAVTLTTLPGIGEATAVKIVSDREANGAFAAIEDLKRVSGIGDKKFEALRDLICV